MYTLGYDFKPWNDAKAIADGPAILRYIRETAEEGGITRHIRFGLDGAQRRVVDPGRLLDGHGRAAPRTASSASCARGSSTCAAATTATLEGHRPQFAGEADYRGTVLQPQFWPENLDYAGKRVVVIGSGATAVTLGA